MVTASQQCRSQHPRCRSLYSLRSHTPVSRLCARGRKLPAALSPRSLRLPTVVANSARMISPAFDPCFAAPLLASLVSLPRPWFAPLPSPLLPNPVAVSPLLLETTPPTDFAYSPLRFRILCILHLDASLLSSYRPFPLASLRLLRNLDMLRELLVPGSLVRRTLAPGLPASVPRTSSLRVASRRLRLRSLLTCGLRPRWHSR